MTGTTVDDLAAEGAFEGLPQIHGSASRLTGHASTRRFYRIRTGRESAILLLYPEGATAELQRYVDTAAWFRRAGLRVPAIRARGRRALLVEDGGDRLLDGYPDHLDPRARCYRQATRAIQRIQRYARREPPPNSDWALDRARLRRELEFTDQHAIRGWLGLAPPSPMRAAALDRIARACASLPRVACHRDFHARNLLIVGDRLMVLDFQDVMWGPVFYDAASLLWDNYCEVPRRWQSAALAQMWEAFPHRLGVLPDWPVPPATLGLPPAARQAFALVALQRSLKALGTFGFQVTVAGNPGFAAYAPRTWSHARRALVWLGMPELADELAGFATLEA